MFDKSKNKVMVMMFENVMLYPPVLNLVECLLNNSYNVYLVAEGIANLPKVITEDVRFSCYDVKAKVGTDLYTRITRRADKFSQVKKQLVNELKDGDLVWTINPGILRALGKTLVPYRDRHIMQLFELMEKDTIPLFSGAKFAKFNIKEYSQHAWKNVVCERNRAYIQKVQWNLDRVPYVLPNKPYYFEVGEATEDMQCAIHELENEKRKIIMYLGVMDPDRDFESFAAAIEKVKDEYCLCMLGKCNEPVRERFEQFCKKYECVKYLGFFNPPHHLYFLKYASIALVPYNPGKTTNNTSSINALYCAPNKIFEYAGVGLPMLGTDVLGLREPFEKFNIGICCESLDTDSIINNIRYIDEHHQEMSENCKSFYNSVDLDSLVQRIINE